MSTLDAYLVFYFYHPLLLICNLNQVICFHCVIVLLYFSSNKDLSVVIGLSKARKDSSFVYCFKLNRRGLITGFPFRLMNKKEKRPWKNKQIRKKRITLGSLIFCKRKPHGHSFKYIKSANKVWVSNGLYMNCCNV